MQRIEEHKSTDPISLFRHALADFTATNIRAFECAFAEYITRHFIEENIHLVYELLQIIFQHASKSKEKQTYFALILHTILSAGDIELYDFYFLQLTLALSSKDLQAIFIFQNKNIVYLRAIADSGNLKLLNSYKNSLIELFDETFMLAILKSQAKFSIRPYFRSNSIERVAKLLMTDAADALAFLAWQIEQDKNPRNARGFFKSKFIAAPEEKEPQQPAHTLF